MPILTPNNFIYIGNSSTKGCPTALKNYNPISGTTENPEIINSNLLNSLLNSFQDEFTNVNVPALSAPPIVSLPITQRSYVKLIFLSKNCLFNNGFGYFTFPTNAPPSSLSTPQINPRIILSNVDISPNGELNQGDFFFLPSEVNPASGEVVDFIFEPSDYLHNLNKSIGFFLVSNGWNGNQLNIVPSLNNVFWSIPSLNPEIYNSYRCHFLNMNSYSFFNNSITIACEDTNNESNSDWDFCDMWFSVQVIPNN